MVQLITVIHIVTCVLLVLVVLMQQGKKDGMGAAFGGGSQSVFGARGAETFLEKFTKGLAVVFMCTSLTLVYFSSKTSSNSILSNEKDTTETTAPATTAPAAAASTTATAPTTSAPAAATTPTDAPLTVTPGTPVTSAPAKDGPAPTGAPVTKNLYIKKSDIIKAKKTGQPVQASETPPATTK